MTQYQDLKIKKQPFSAAIAMSIALSIASLAGLQSCATAPALDAKPAATSVAAAPTVDPIRRTGLPLAPVRAVSETFFGQTVTDPYRYLEDVKNPEVTAYMRAQGEHARAMLDSIPGRTKMAARIAELADSSVAISGVQITGSSATPRVFYYKLSPGETMRKLYVRDGFNGAERLLFDAQSLTVVDPQASANPIVKPIRWALDFYRASPDGAHVAVGVAAGGSEETSIRVIEVAGVNQKSPQQTSAVIDRIGFADGLSWAPDSKSFFYNRLPAQKSGEAKNQYLKSVAFRHVLGRAAAQDEAIFGPGTVANITFADIDIPHVELTADNRFLIGKIAHGDLREISLYVADASQLPGSMTWKKAVEPKDGVTAYAPASGALYLLTHKDAPRNKIMRANLAKPDFASATTIVPQGETVITQISLAQDALYIHELVGGVDDRLQRWNFSSNSLRFVRLPFDLAIRQMITDPQRSGALLRLEGWTESPQYVNIEARTGNITDTRLLSKSKVDFEGMTEVHFTVTAKDGAKIPLSLIYKKGMTLNAYNPALIRAYGAYGITQSPSFSPTSMAWLERGGILATCHVRGGGELGDEWHRAGQKLTKPNSWRDLIACSEYLIQRKFTRKELLAIQGGSAGGITVGRALTERPDLFAAVVPAVGLLDALRAEFTPNGPPNIPEFGSVKTEDGFKGLLEMSSVHQVKDGTNYPAVLLMHGVNDPRVDVWHSAKMAARLQAANVSVRDAKPVLLRLDYDAGHGVGSTKSQRNAELADIYSFLLWQFKDPEFQPK